MAISVRGPGVRVTLSIDDDLLDAARMIAKRDDTTAGVVISGLARRGLSIPSAPFAHAGRIPTYAPRPGAPMITSRVVVGSAEG